MGELSGGRGLRFRVLVLVGVLMAAAGLSGCGQSEEKPGTKDTPRAVSGGAAAKFLLDESELPQGWRDATGEQHRGVPQLCGVTLEPPQLQSADTKRVGKSFAGPFVIQYSFVAKSEDSAAKGPDALAAKIGECSSTSFQDVEIAVEPLSDITQVGTGFVAVKLSEVKRPEREQRWVTFRNGTHVTVLVSYSVQPEQASPADLNKIIAAIEAKEK